MCAELVRRGQLINAATRGEGIEACVAVNVGDIDGSTQWKEALHDVEIVIHLAARVHILRDNDPKPLDAFRRVNVAGTENLARAAAAGNVKRLVYVSSIKVNGEETAGDRRYAETDIPAPHDPYGISKWEAEQVLHRVARETGLEVVIIRPPLVYGAGVKGNFVQMMQAVARGLPLPFAAVRNRRDLLYVGNLVDAMIVCATHPAASGQTFLLSDGEPVSTPELLRRLAAALGTAPRVFPFPPTLLALAGRLTGKSAQLARLLGSLQVDSGKIRRELNWTPPYTLEQGLHATAEWYRNTHL